MCEMRFCVFLQTPSVPRIKKNRYRQSLLLKIRVFNYTHKVAFRYQFASLMNSKSIRETNIVCFLISSVFVTVFFFYTTHLSIDSSIFKRKQSLFLLETKQEFFASHIHDDSSNLSRKRNFVVTMNDTINYTINNITKDTAYKFTNHTKNNPPLSIYVVSLQGVTGANPENKGRLDNFI